MEGHNEGDTSYNGGHHTAGEGRIPHRRVLHDKGCGIEKGCVSMLKNLVFVLRNFSSNS
jgi:hypothetical protein